MQLRDDLERACAEAAVGRVVDDDCGAVVSHSRGREAGAFRILRDRRLRASGSPVYGYDKAPRGGRLRDALHRDPVGGHAEARRVALARVPGLLEGTSDDVVELRVHLVLAPEVLLQTLHPLEVRDDDPARVREHVGEHENASLLEDRVGARRHRAVGALADHRRLHAVGVRLGDHLLERARREDVAGKLDELLVRHGIRVARARRALRAPACARARDGMSSPAAL